MKFIINNASFLFILIITFRAYTYENINYHKYRYVNRDTTRDTLKSIENNSTYIKGKNEIGIITGILSENYSGCEYPLGIYYAYHYSEYLFIQPLVSWQWGESSRDNYSYYHLGLVHGFMGDPGKFPCYFTIGFAFSHFKHITKYADTISYKGFFAPMEFGIKTYFLSKRTLLTIGFTDSFNKVTEYIEFGVGILCSITLLL